jgi:type IV secretion system protein VirB9
MGKDPRLNPKEWEAAKLAARWINQGDMPVMEADGKIVYLYGATLPSVVCSPLQLCDLELQPAEVVKDVHVGDTVRWKVSPALSGPVGGETTHLIIKPTEIGLSTTMVVTTDRRTYHVKLISRRKNFTPRVGFNYPGEVRAAWAAYHAAQSHRQLAGTLPGGERIDDLDFGYTIEGAARWKPLRVFNNGVKTIIQMPHTLRQTEAPALLVIGDGDQKQLVNYRLHGDRYIVDQVFQRAILITGVGRQQTRVTITRTE